MEGKKLIKYFLKHLCLVFLFFFFFFKLSTIFGIGWVFFCLIYLPFYCLFVYLFIWDRILLCRPGCLLSAGIIGIHKCLAPVCFFGSSQSPLLAVGWQESPQGYLHAECIYSCRNVCAHTHASMHTNTYMRRTACKSHSSPASMWVSRGWSQVIRLGRWGVS